ncbi:MAG: GAF domain-containing protein [Xanthomonadales bacterium]|nr:GAF domain-containing protein [Xanthomonadales bacterium]NIN58726.1 GAF domain-containing protein [Xanthomonadales bacterium]NIN73992.1 GAF domain-containing protein [Xanthomonadales bacterium]NIO12907.1 GAF domain-containing protein [Xanthomonadales bacterium]NIP11119.1 GAF domain-containing protein [Xanthomonadales bacterium]
MSELDYDSLAAQAQALLSGAGNAVSKAANLSALIYQALPSVNWAGFYFLEGDVLVLGPFQGKPACVSIPVGEGVCGTAAARRVTQRVADVHAFEGHIVCDPESRSELVVPLVLGDELLGVLDVDSPQPGRFSAEDEAGLARLAELFVQSVAV